MKGMKCEHPGCTCGEFNPVYSEKICDVDRSATTPNQIEMYLTCSNCFKDKPSDVSMEEYARLEIGLTELGIQIWCVRCNMNVGHIFLATPH
jgi:hypothetical protein